MKNKTHLIPLIGAVLLLGLPTTLSGCAVGMALQGEREPNLAACRVGATRGEIELLAQASILGGKLCRVRGLGLARALLGRRGAGSLRPQRSQKKEHQNERNRSVNK